MKRLHQVLLISTFLPLSWLAMQAVHELGHVAGAAATGGRVERVVLHPLTISRTDVSPNLHPLIVVWAGPIVGVMLPILLFLAARRFKWAYLLQFFAGFCLIANGAYISIGSFDRIGDCSEMLRHGSDPWQLWLFGFICVPAGFWLWHLEGRHFGLGTPKGEINMVVAYGTSAIAMALLILGILVGGE